MFKISKEHWPIAWPSNSPCPKNCVSKMCCPSSWYFAAEPIIFFHMRAHSHLETLGFKLNLALLGLQFTFHGQKWFPALKNDLTSLCTWLAGTFWWAKCEPIKNIWITICFLDHTCDFNRNECVPKHFVLLSFLSGHRTWPRRLEGAERSLAFPSWWGGFLLEPVTFFLPPVWRFLWGISPDKPTLSFSVIPFPQMVAFPHRKMQREQGLAILLWERLILLTQPWRKTITPTCFPPQFTNKKEKGSENFTSVTELIWKS